MPDDKSKKPRFKERDDDDDDDRPRKRRKSRDDDDNVRPKRKAKRGGLSLPLILGGGALLVLILGCCGVGGYFAFFRGGGSSPRGIGDHLTLTSGIVVSTGRNDIYLSLGYTMNVGVEKTEDYWFVVKIGGKKYDSKMKMHFAAPDTNGSQGAYIDGVTSTAPPYEVWVEKRPVGVTPKVVSNTISVR